MFHIERFILNNNKAELGLSFASNKINNGEIVCLPYEFIRVMSPQGSKSKTVISHKKNVKLQSIESVAKHGYRLIFDDQHSAIYSNSHLEQLCQRHKELWQQYLEQLKTSGHSREATIDITQL
jgi:DUF971 family protein|tara:strand:- start:787 stop:1155 length:369 start_codon:yes stop_codon:yes gene_type:complete